MAYQVYYTHQALDDWETLKRTGNPSLTARTQQILAQIKENPFVTSPPYKKLKGELSGLYARGLDLQHRLVYQVLEESKAIKVISMWTHYSE